MRLPPRPGRFQTKRERLERFEGLSPGSQDQIMALTVLSVPSLLDSGISASLKTISGIPRCSSINPKPALKLHRPEIFVSSGGSAPVAAALKKSKVRSDRVRPSRAESLSLSLHLCTAGASTGRTRMRDQPLSLSPPRSLSPPPLPLHIPFPSLCHGRVDGQDLRHGSILGGNSKVGVLNYTDGD